MKSILAYAPILVILILTIGCNAENPICTTNFCAVGEVFPRSELDTANFSEVDIDDSVIFATLVGDVPQRVQPIPAEPDIQKPSADSVAFTDIVRNVANGGTRYSNKTVTFSAVVQFDASGFTNNEFITLETNNRKVVFYVQSVEDPAKVAHYQEGESYTFTVFVEQIAQPTLTFDSYAVLTTILENDGVLSVSLANLVSDAVSGNNRYVNKVVRFTATVASDKSVFTPSDTITVATGNNNVSFFVTNRTKHLSVMGKYRSGMSYTFTVYISEIKPSAVNAQRQNIWGRIVLE